MKNSFLVSRSLDRLHFILHIIYAYILKPHKEQQILPLQKYKTTTKNDITVYDIPGSLKEEKVLLKHNLYYRSEVRKRHSPKISQDFQ